MSALVPPGTPIAVVAPSHAYDVDKLATGLEIVRAHGHDPRPFDDMLRPHRYFAADDDTRLAHLVEALTSPDYGAVWMVRGGSGLTRLLPRIPWDDLPRRPVIGFSDVTALLNPLADRRLGPAVHGPVVHSLADTDDASVAHLFDLLAGRPLAPLTGEAWVPGAAEGRLVGGNLCVVAAMCGTPFQVDGRDGLVVLEEIGESLYRVDRSLQQLVSAGVFEGARGVVLGEFTRCHAPDGVDWGLKDIVLEHLGPLGIPVLADVPVGHGARNRAFVVGGLGRMTGESLSWRDDM